MTTGRINQVAALDSNPKRLYRTIPADPPHCTGVRSCESDRRYQKKALRADRLLGSQGYKHRTLLLPRGLPDLFPSSEPTPRKHLQRSRRGLAECDATHHLRPPSKTDWHTTSRRQSFRASRQIQSITSRGLEQCTHCSSVDNSVHKHAHRVSVQAHSTLAAPRPQGPKAAYTSEMNHRRP